jgi:hypothetical protein
MGGRQLRVRAKACNCGYEKGNCSVAIWVRKGLLYIFNIDGTRLRTTVLYQFCLRLRKGLLFCCSLGGIWLQKEKLYCCSSGGMRLRNGLLHCINFVWDKVTERAPVLG